MTNSLIAWLRSTTPDFWTAVFTFGLLVIAVAALVIARGQLRLADRERAVGLIKEAAADETEQILGFFDFAADKRVSREAFSNLYRRLIKERPAAIRTNSVADVQGAAAAAVDSIVLEMDGGAASRVEHDQTREEKVRRRLIAATNFFERAWALLKNRAIDSTLFLEGQSYNIVATYFITEPILNDLVKHEGFDFEDFRQLTLAAKDYLSWLKADDPLRIATFDSLPLDGPSLRERSRVEWDH